MSESIHDLEIGKIGPGDYWIEGYHVFRQRTGEWIIEDGDNGPALGFGWDTLREAKRYLVDYLNGVPGVWSGHPDAERRNAEEARKAS